MEKNYLLQVTADTNDADYITESTKVSMNEIQKLIPLIEIIKNCEDSHNWPRYDYGSDTVEELYEGVLTSEEIDLIDNYRPYGEYGIHTIVSIIYYPIEAEVKLL